MYSLARRTLSRNFAFGVRARVFNFDVASFDCAAGFAPVRRLPSRGEFFLDARDVFHGALVGRFGRFARHVGRGHDVDLVTQMIEGEHAVEKHQHTVGNIQVIAGVLSDVLQPPHNVIRAIADRAGGERRQAFHCRRTMLLQQFLDDFEDVSRAPLDFAAPFDIDFRAARLQAQKRAHSQKCIASDFFSAFDRFQQERVGSPSATARKAETGVSRSAEIDFATGNERGAARQADELFVVGTDHDLPRISLYGS
jgi:hypothetical protein